MRYASRIVVVKGEKHGSATSLLSLMKVGCSQGDRIAVP
ncbi:MAG: HPr family phosphocarrier protein [Roseiarcus sp.]